MRTSLSIIISVLSGSCLGQLQPIVQIPWSLANSPPTGFGNISFPFNLENTLRDFRYMIGQQISFIGQQDTAYAGLAPERDENGHGVIRAAFTSYIPGTTSHHKNCESGGDGVFQCLLDISFTYSQTGTIHVANIGNTTWTATWVDSAPPRKSLEIGTWTLPKGSQGIRGTQTGVIDYLLWHLEDPACRGLPRTEVTFGLPLAGSAIGSLDEAYETSAECQGKISFEQSKTSNGVRVAVGF